VVDVTDAPKDAGMGPQQGMFGRRPMIMPRGAQGQQQPNQQAKPPAH
jgi:hypothetical protein